MCGIVGVLGTDVTETDLKAFRDLVVMDTVRGFDSTGIMRLDASLKKDETPAWVKDTVTGGEMVTTKDFRDMAVKDDLWSLIGHNRAATVGAVTADAAHPFQEGAITLVHNGTLTRTNTMDKCQDTLNAHNDSHTICHNLALVEPDKARDVIEKLTGAYALVWHDARDQSLNILRNSQRPLHMAAHNVRQVLYLSSDVNILHAALRRNRIAGSSYYELDVGIHLKFSADSMVPEVSQFTPGKQVTYASPYPYPAQGGAGHGWNGYSNSGRGATVFAPEPTKATQHKFVVPAGLKEELESWSLSDKEEYGFMPALYRPGWTGTNAVKKVCVSGTIDMGGWEVCAEIHGIADATIEKYGSRAWTVRPVGLKYSYGATSRHTPDMVCDKQAAMEFDQLEEAAMPIVICKVLSLHHKDYLLDKADKKEMQEVKEPVEEVQPVYTRRSGTNIWDTPEARAKAIEGGCIQCGTDVSTEDPTKLCFVNGGVDPLCRVCVAETANMIAS